MLPLSFQYLVIGVLAASVLAVSTVWTTRSVWVRVFAVVALLLSASTMMLSLKESFGTPKLVALESMKVEKATVLSARMREGVAIYVWLLLPNHTEPRYYALPWDQDMAQQLQKALEAMQNGDELQMNNPFERSWDKRERKFYAEPQPKMPDKPQQKQAPAPTYRQQEL